MNIAAPKNQEFPAVELAPGQLVATVSDAVGIVMAATNRQVELKGIKDPAGRDEFTLSSDALNLRRLVWRLAEEWGGVVSIERGLVEALQDRLCRERGYDPDDFESAKRATRDRARLPFGWTSLDLAVSRANRKPIRLLVPDLSDSRLPTKVAAVALQLQLLQDNLPILLPIEQLRIVFGQRKVVVSGAVLRLAEGGVLECVRKEYNTGRAREYRFTGVEGKHFEFVHSQEERAGET